MTVPTAIRELAAYALLALLVCASLGAGFLATQLTSGVLAVAAALAAAVLAGLALSRPVGRGVGSLVDGL